MAYRFNGGIGAVTCDVCHVIIDQDLSFNEYEDTYVKRNPDGDICWKCHNGIKDHDKDKDFKEKMS